MKERKRKKQKNKQVKLYIYRLSSGNKTLSSLVKKRGLCTKVMITTKYFFSKCYQICRKLRIWSYLMKKFLIKNFFFVQWVYIHFSKSLQGSKWAINTIFDRTNFVIPSTFYRYNIVQTSCNIWFIAILFYHQFMLAPW